MDLREASRHAKARLPAKVKASPLHEVFGAEEGALPILATEEQPFEKALSVFRAARAKRGAMSPVVVLASAFERLLAGEWLEGGDEPAASLAGLAGFRAERFFAKRTSED